MRHAGLVFAAACVAACTHAAQPDPNASITRTLGAITVLSRDHDSGEVVAHADLVLRGPETRMQTSSKYGFTTFDRLTPGTYDLVATFAAQPYEIDGIAVRPNQTLYLDVAFTLGRADPIKVHFGDAHSAAIDKYRPKDINPMLGRIEGTVTDSTTHASVAGAVVTAQAAASANVLQAVTDDRGRYRIDDAPPGTYVISADYSMGGRGQIEVRRSDIAVAAGDAVIVPLAVEIAR